MWVLSLVVLLTTLAYVQARQKVWLAMVSLWLIAYTFLGSSPWFCLLLTWVIYATFAVFCLYRPLRIRWLVLPSLKLIQRKIPPISTTEKIAIEAGDIGWEGELFTGRPDWRKLLGLPRPQLSTDEQSFLSDQVETLCSLLDDWQINQAHDLPINAWQYIKQHGFLGMIIPKEYGGLGFSALAHSTVITRMASSSASAAVSVMVPNSLGPAELLLHYGTEQQKQYYLPRLARGEEIPCFALTGVESGSDAGAMYDSGVICTGEYQGKKTLGIRLNWDKRYITLAPIATVLGLAFILFDPDHLLGDKDEIGITLCLIPVSHPGVEIGTRHCPLNLAFMNGPTRGKDVFIPLEWIIGGVAMAGRGWQMLMECLASGRGISLPALSTATGKYCTRVTSGYAFVRQQFHLPIAYFEGVALNLAKLGGYAYLLEAVRLLTVSQIDTGQKPAIASAMAKYHMTEMARKAVNHAMDIHGGKAIQLGPKNYLGMAYSSIPISITVEGANILTRNLIIFGQGMMRCHPYIQAFLKFTSNTENHIGDFEALLFKQIRYSLCNFARTLVWGLSGGHLISVPAKGKVKRYLRQMTRMSATLAFISDICLLMYGGGIKRREALSARLGDVWSYLYLASSVVKYHLEQEASVEEEKFMQWTLQWCLAQIQNAWDEVFSNFTPAWLGKILGWAAFPWGRAYYFPKDQLSQTLAKVLITPSAYRDHLTSDIQRIEDVEQAFMLAVKNYPIHKRLQAAFSDVINVEEKLSLAVAQGILTSEEARLWQASKLARQQLIQVDEFSPDYFKK